MRIVPFIMPSGRIIPGGELQGPGNATIVLEIPIDDENTATYSVRYGSQPIPRDVRLRETGFDDPALYAESTQRFLPTRADYLHHQRRDQMDRRWTGFRGIAAEDAFIATSMGPISDRRASISSPPTWRSSASAGVCSTPSTGWSGGWIRSVPALTRD